MGISKDAGLPIICYAVQKLAPKPPAPKPIRCSNIGRNDPCPCGSGKKYKRCCRWRDRKGKITTRLELIEQGLKDNGCEVVEDADGRVWIRNNRAEAVETVLRYHRRLVRKLPTLDEVRLAILANNGGSLERRNDRCQCDPSTGMVSCEYCAIDYVLNRVLRLLETAANPPATE